MNLFRQNAILQAARGLIGQTYASLDCSHFVHEAYEEAGYPYPYHNSVHFGELAGDRNAPFLSVPATGQKEGGDVIVMFGHMGIWDPQGCTILTNNPECSRLGGNAPFLSSRKGGNRGPDFGRTQWWNGNYTIYRWID